MNEANLALVKADETDLRTIEQMAVAEHVSIATITRRIKEAGIEPVRAAIDTDQGRVPALYSYPKISVILGRERTSALTPSDRSSIVLEHLNALDTMDKASLALQAFASVIDELKALQRATEEEKEALERQLDCEINTGTLEKFNEEYRWGATAQQLSVLSRRLGKHYTNRERVVSIEHPNGVWSYVREDILDSQRKFPHFWEGLSWQ